MAGKFDTVEVGCILGTMALISHAAERLIADLSGEFKSLTSIDPFYFICI